MTRKEIMMKAHIERLFRIHSDFDVSYQQGVFRDKIGYGVKVKDAKRFFTDEQLNAGFNNRWLLSVAFVHPVEKSMRRAIVLATIQRPQETRFKRFIERTLQKIVVFYRKIAWYF